MSTLTEIIAERLERASKATPGPWSVDALQIGTPWNVETVDGSVAIALAQQIYGDKSVGQPARIANADFIAAARTEYPQALAALQVAVDALAASCGCGVTHCGTPYSDCLEHLNFAIQNPEKYTTGYLQRIIDGKELCRGCKNKAALAAILETLNS